MTEQFRGLGGWVTNSPAVAKKLRAADMRYERAKIMTQGMRLGEKIEAQRVAKEQRQAEYDAIFAEASSPHPADGLGEVFTMDEFSQSIRQ